MLSHGDYSAVDVVDGYLEGMEAADGLCPTWFEFEGQSYWFADCTATTGTTYSGYAFSYTYEQTDVYNDGNLWDSDSVYGYATIIDPTDQWYHLGGYAYYGESQSEAGHIVTHSVLQGGFLWEGQEMVPLLQDGFSLNLHQYSVDYTAYSDARMLSLSGQLTGFSEEGEAIDIESLIAASTNVGNSCEQEFIGSLRIRDAEGSWWDLSFDIDPETWEIDDGLCDGCGTVSRAGETFGQVCVDATEVLQWEKRPW
jgi:hypothetical protein